MIKPDCYKCRYKVNISGNSHIKCTHPYKNFCAVEAAYHGVRKGWFDYPHNFDPVWLIACNGFEQKIIKKEERLSFENFRKGYDHE